MGRRRPCRDLLLSEEEAISKISNEYSENISIIN